jgi:6-phosphogluconate dehydrogenase
MSETDVKAQLGMIGMAVMGRSLALNIVDHGFSVAVWNLESEMTDAAVQKSDS